jgi:outer membrane protein TolC
MRFFLPILLAASPLAAQFNSIELPVDMAVDKSNFLEAPTFGTRAWLSRHFNPSVPRVELEPPARLEDFIVGGNLELSLRSYIELVMTNNTEIQIQKFGVEPQRNAITRAFGAFDPSVGLAFRSTRATQLPTSSIGGGATVTSLNQPFSVAYNQVMDTGTQLTLGYNGSKISTNSNNATFNPTFSSNMQMGFTQPLLRGRGRSNQLIPVLVAQTRFRSAEASMEDQILRLIQQAELAYWQVVEARENLRVQEQALEMQDVLLKRSLRELELGAISPLDIYQPQQNYANQEVRMTQARYNLIQAEDNLRRQIGADLDSQFHNMPIVLTETALPPADSTVFDREELVQVGLRNRPDLEATANNLAIDDLNMRQARNNLKPDLSLTGNFAGAGRGGTQLIRDGLTGPVIGFIPGGIADSLSNAFAFNFPTYGLGLNFNFPVRDRRAAADLADATVNKRLDALRVRGVQQQIRQEVLNAVTQVESSRASVQLAQVAMDFSQKRLEAEQKKYDLGVTTVFFVLDAQTQLTNAQANVVQQSVQYRRNLLNLLRVTGQLLDERGIQVR